MPPPTKRAEVGASGYICGDEELFAHGYCGFCGSLERRTRDCEERGAEKGPMLAKMKVPANCEVGLMAATIGAAHGDDEEQWNLDSDATLQMFHTRVGMTAYKKAPPGTTVDVTDGTILPVDEFGTIEMDLDQPGTTNKPMKMVAVAYVPGPSRNLLSARKSVEQWGKPLVYYKTKAV